MDNHYYLLLTNNPDKYYEYFWISFKQSIYDVSSEYIKKEFDICSNNLNKLQKEQKFDEILLCMEQFFFNNINQIIAEIYLVNVYKLHLLKTNIHRLMKFQPTFILNSFEYDILINITNIINKENYDKIKIIMTTLSNYLQQCINFNKYQITCLSQNQDLKLNRELYNLINLCIEHNIISIIDTCAQYIDITLFYKDNIDKKKFKCVKGAKLMKLIEQKSIKSLVS